MLAKADSDRVKTFRQRLDESDVCYGLFSKTSDPFLVEIMGLAGFDFVILDAEHGPNSPREMYPLVVSAQLNNVFPIIRTGGHSENEIARALDLGVAGLQIPQIGSAQEARDVVAHAKFSPQGSRGVCRFVRAAQFSLQNRNEYFESANETALILMIEGAAAVRELPEILAVEGVDVVFIGPYDLSQSLNVIGQVDNPLVLRKIEEIVATCRTANKYVGTFVDSLEAARRYKALGVKYLAYSVDVGIFAQACQGLVRSLKAI